MEICRKLWKRVNPVACGIGVHTAIRQPSVPGSHISGRIVPIIFDHVNFKGEFGRRCSILASAVKPKRRPYTRTCGHLHATLKVSVSLSEAGLVWMDGIHDPAVPRPGAVLRH